LTWQQSLSEVELEEFRGPAVGQLRSVLIKMDTSVPGERMAATRVGKNLGELVSSEGGNDCFLCLFGDVFVLFAQVHHERALDIRRFT
jgi:hypothetical protein